MKGLAVTALALALEDGVVRAVVAGALVGLAAVLRTEVLLYAAFVAAALLFVRSERRAWFGRPARLDALATIPYRSLTGVALAGNESASMA